MRTRMSTERRREQLLGIGVELFAERPYEEVWIEEVAEIAGVSRGLLYHYFATKREFFAAIVRAERDRLLERSAPDPDLEPHEQLVAGLDVYLDYASAHPHGYRLVHRAAGDAPEIREIRDEGIAMQHRRILDGLGSMIPVTPSVEIAVTGWLAFTVEITLSWLENPTVPRRELRDLAARTLFTAVGVEL